MSKLVASITNTPRSIKGLKPKAYWCYRDDVSLTIVDNKVTGVSTGILGVIEGCKFFMNSGSEIVVNDDNFSGFKQKFSATINDGGEVLDGMENIVLFVETMAGTKYVLGSKYGLWKASQSQMSNDNLATTSVEFASREGMEETASSYLLDFDISGIPTTDTHEAITGLSIATDGVMNLTVYADKTCYIIAPDGSVITSTDGVINTTWGGSDGKVTLIVPKNQFINITASDFIGSLKTDIPDISANACNYLTSIHALKATYISCSTCASLTNIYSDFAYINCSSSILIESLSMPLSTSIRASGAISLSTLNIPFGRSLVCDGCALTAKSIGDFLIAASVNNPTVAGVANFSGGTNASYGEIQTYFTSIGFNYNGYSDMTEWLAGDLETWTITIR